MLAHTQQFKEELNTFARQYKNKISIYKDLILTSQDNKNFITEDGLDLIAKKSMVDVDYEIDDEHLYSIKLITKGELLSTLMKELEIESDLNLKVGDVLNYQFGIYVNNSYEYLNYGKFIVYKKEYKNDTKTYLYTCYDFMLKSMVEISNEFAFDVIPTGADIIPKICDILGINFDNSLVEQDNITPTPYGMIKNLTYIIDINAIKEAKITYRDLLNILCQYFGVSMYMNNNDLKIKLLGKIKYSNNEWIVDNNDITIEDTIGEETFKDKNVTFSQIYGKINGLNISGTDEGKTAYVEDSQSVVENGLTLFEVKNNLLLSNKILWEEHSNDITNNIFELINGVSFNLCDFSTFGIMYLEWLDYFNVNINGQSYKCLLLNSEITVKSGINENIYTELPEKNVSQYTTTPKSNDVIGDTIRARGNAYANGYKLAQENEIDMYSTNEIVIGKWVDNKPIYKNVLIVQSPVFNSYISHNISNIDTIININWMLKTGNNTFRTLPIVYQENNSIVARFCCSPYLFNKTEYFISAGTFYTENSSNMVLRIVIEYTKTTD